MKNVGEGGQINFSGSGRRGVQRLGPLVREKKLSLTKMNLEYFATTLV